MKSPFKFLDSYTKDDREIFFGRDREIEELYQKVFDSKLLLVYGVSGTGKSSLIHCGLANKFNDTDWLPLVVRRGSNIIDSTASAIKSASVTPQEGQFTTPAQFRKGVRSLYLDHYKPVFFIFDQFEELFIFGDKEERKSFVQIVKSLIDSDLQCRLIFVMREEYMAGITEFERYIPTFFANRVRIEKMSHINALEAIIKPCKVFNISLEEGFAETLVEKLSPENADVELTFLQVFLDKIFRLTQQRRSDKDGVLFFSINLLMSTGNVSNILGDFLDEQVSLLENPEEALAVLKSFVSTKGSRRQIDMEEIAEYVQTLGHPLMTNILQNLIQTFLNLRIICDKDQNGKYELRHDALATKIFEKITLVEKEILEIRQFIDNAFVSYKKRRVYLSSDDLNYIGPYESRIFFSKELSVFIDESRRRLTIIKQRRRNLIGASTVAILFIFAGFTLWALIEKNVADKAGLRQLESILKLNENFEKVKNNQEQRKEDIYQAFEMAYLTNPSRVREFRNKALKIKKASNELTEYIYQLEYIMYSESENISPDSARKTSLGVIKNKSNTTIPYQILFMSNGDTGLSKVFFLHQKIQNYIKTVSDQIDKKDWDKINFSIDLEKPYYNAKGESVSWENANFGETILAGAITNLNSLITEINYIELDAINLINSWISIESFKFNAITPTIIPQSNYVTIGSSYTAQLMLSAYDTRTNLEAYIFEGKDSLSENDMQNTNNMIPLTSKLGIIDINIPAIKLGPQRISGYISVKAPDGESRKLLFSKEYLVGEPVIFIAPINMNVLYLDVYNPIDISIPGVSLNTVRVKLSHGTFFVKDGHFMVKPSKMEDCNMTVIAANKDGTTLTYPPLRFTVKMKPEPICSIEGVNEDKIKKDELLRSKRLIAYYPSDFDFGVDFKVIGFTTTIIRNGQIIKASSSSDLLSEEQRKLITEMKKSDKLYIQDITVKATDGSVLSLKGIIYTID